MKQPGHDFDAKQSLDAIKRRFMDGIDDEILYIQNPLRRLLGQAEMAVAERFGRKLKKLLNEIGEADDDD